MTTVPAVCPRCSGAIFRDYEDWWCVRCGPLTPAVEEAREAELRAELELQPGKVRKRGAGHFIGGQRSAL